MGGLIANILGGGPSPQQKMDAAQQTSLADNLFSNYQQLFGENQQFVNQLKNSYSPIVAGGINQQGFSAPELASLNTSAINSSAAASRNARQAAGNFAAGQNNSSGLTSGVTKQINAGIDSNATNQLATAQNQIQQANYATGRSNYLSATAGLQALSGQQGSEAGQAASDAGSGFSSAFGEEDKIQQEKQARMAGIFGGITGLLGAAIPGAGAISAGISALAPKADTGFLDAIAGA